MALHNYKVQVIVKKFTFCPGKSQENFPHICQDYKQNSRTFQDSKKKNNSGLFQNVATLFLLLTNIPDDLAYGWNSL